MGFFSKVWKGIKKGVKKIGKGIKKVAVKVGKFMDRIGIVGQIGLAFILPGIGSMLGGMVGGMASSTNFLVSGLGRVLQTAGQFAHTVGNAFRTVTEGVTSFIGTMAKSTVNHLASSIGMQPVFGAAPQTIGAGFNKWMEGVAHNASNITSPFANASTEAITEVASAYDAGIESPIEKIGAAFPEGPATTQTDSVFSVSEIFGENSPLNSLPDPSTYKQIVDAEDSTWGRYAQRIGNYALDTAKALPEAGIDIAAEAVGAGVKQKVMGSMGLGPRPPVYNTVYNEVPEINTSRTSQMYEMNGFNYGATPQTSIEYYAATNSPQYGNFGRNAHQRVAPLFGS